jgi:hypothetical protein
VSFPDTATSRCWRRKFEPLLSRRWVVDPRAAAFFLQTPMRLKPAWRLGPILHPVSDGGFITPLRQSRHDPAMRTCAHKRAHRRFICPHRARPKGAVGITQDRNLKVSMRPPGLARGEH